MAAICLRQESDFPLQVSDLLIQALQSYDQWDIGIHGGSVVILTRTCGTGLPPPGGAYSVAASAGKVITMVVPALVSERTSTVPPQSATQVVHQCHRKSRRCGQLERGWT